jgi:hypothetical protein
LVYVDVQATGDFLRDLVGKGKEWFATQHGDRFTLAVKRRVERERPEVEVVGWKQEVRADDGHQVECDLLLATKSTLLVVECKAFEKSAQFYRGDRKAVRFRSLKLKKALGQAREGATAVQQAVARADISIPKRARVEAVVCTPAQEFVHPVGAFGFIAPEIPRICTPEELLSALSLLP